MKLISRNQKEVKEETNIKSEDYELIENVLPIIENFTGENDIRYRNIYYIGVCKNTDNIRVNSENIHQKNEIRDKQTKKINEKTNK